jgi:hypothetical protein
MFVQHWWNTFNARAVPPGCVGSRFDNAHPKDIEDMSSNTSGYNFLNIEGQRILRAEHVVASSDPIERGASSFGFQRQGAPAQQIQNRNRFLDAMLTRHILL